MLRFQIRFPTSYPDLPPLVTFSTDVFHPLIVPLTTYTFSTNASTEDPVSATDEERLSPGGFSLRHGFPHWFGRAKRSGVSTASSRAVSVQGRAPVLGEATAAKESQGNDKMDFAKGQGEDGTIEQYPEPRKTVPVAELLDYIRSTFEDESVLDSLTLEAAGNPGAWHAWRAHKGSSNSTTKSDHKRGSPQTRLPGDWHWDGIWAKRVQSEVEASHSEPMLYGNSARAVGDEMVRSWVAIASVLRGFCLLISGCRFAFLAWTMPVWLRLKRGSFLARRRYTNNFMILVSVSAVSLYPGPVDVSLVCRVLALSYFGIQQYCTFLLCTKYILPGITALCLPRFPTPSFSSSIHIRTYYYFTLLVAGSICQELYPSVSRPPPS